jgi:hypothetical protein
MPKKPGRLKTRKGDLGKKGYTLCGLKARKSNPEKIRDLSKEKCKLTAAHDLMTN